MPRWTLHDPAAAETWEMPMSPNKMTSPHPPRNTTIFARGIGAFSNRPGWGVSRALAFRQQPYEWSFSGAIRTEAHYLAFCDWIKRTGRLELTDHFGRTWQIRMDSVDLTERKPTARRAWRYEYTVKTMIYGRIS